MKPAYDTHSTDNVHYMPEHAKTRKLSNWTITYAGAKYTPLEGAVPNAFQRLMVKVFFGFVWRKNVV